MTSTCYEIWRVTDDDRVICPACLPDPPHEIEVASNA
jgi:hypothetical protein